jgi:hypothetical protein
MDVMYRLCYEERNEREREREREREGEWLEKKNGDDR